VNGWDETYACVMTWYLDVRGVRPIAIVRRWCVDRTSRDSLSTASGSIVGMDVKRGDEWFE